ncbi:MAG: EVE domain-containing protein [Blastomonas sp.]
MGKSYWLMKSEPDAYGWDHLVAEGEGIWDGVKNAQASNNLKAMKAGDEAFFYHSNIGLEIVGIVTVSQTAFPDPHDETGRWVAVKVRPVRKLANPVSLKAIKAEAALGDMKLVRQSRLSVSPVSAAEWRYILKMAGE